MNYTVIISDRARQLLAQHIRFLVRVSKSAAAELKQRFLAEFRSLEALPQRYPFFEAPFIPPCKYHKLYIKNWFLVLYQIRDDTVYIDWIVDCRRDYPWLLK